MIFVQESEDKVSIRVSSLLWIVAWLSPLWWVLGWLQFIWLPLLLLILLLHIAQRGKIHLPAEAVTLSMFLLTQLVSVISIQDNYRYITFAKTLWGYFTTLLLIIYIASHPKPERVLAATLKSLLGIITVSVLISIIAQLEWWLNGSILSFNTWTSAMLPDWVRSTSLGRAVFEPSVGRVDWFMGASYLRHSAMSLFATTYSMALVASLPVLIWIVRTQVPGLRGIWRRVAGFTCFASLGALVMTTGRMSILGLLLGAAWFGLIYRPRIRIAISLVLFAVIIYSVMFGHTYVNDVLFARGEGSVVTRHLIYTKTWQYFSYKPIIGWGSEVDISNVGYPLGSHSQYLSILFRFGLVGMGLWSLWILTIWIRAQKILQKDARAYLSWSLIAMFVNGLTDVWDLDLLTLYIMSLVFAVVYLASKLQSKELRGSTGEK